MLEHLAHAHAAQAWDSLYRRDIVQVEVGFLDTLTMIAFWVRQAEQSLLEEIAIESQQDISYAEYIGLLFLVPKGKRNVLKVVCVGDARNAVFSPPVRSRASVIVGKVWTLNQQLTLAKQDLALTAPGITIATVVLSDYGTLSVGMTPPGSMLEYLLPTAARRRKGPISSSTWSAGDPRSNAALPRRWSPCCQCGPS